MASKNGGHESLIYFIKTILDVPPETLLKKIGENIDDERMESIAPCLEASAILYSFAMALGLSVDENVLLDLFDDKEKFLELCSSRFDEAIKLMDVGVEDMVKHILGENK